MGANVDCKRKVKIEKFSRRRSYEKEALDESCEGLRKMLVKLEALEAAQGIE
jgi:hypothetical protein